MSAGIASLISGQRRREMLLAVMVFVVPRLAWAIDDPDAPDRVSEFLARARPYEQAVGDAVSSYDIAKASGAYSQFLDHELNSVYQQLLSRVPIDARRELTRSQRQWLEFRDAEIKFIYANWTPAQFGSSSALSRADYRTSLVKQRVLTLLDYMRNYGDEKP